MDVLNEKEKEKANSARMVAGFCWPWSTKTDANGELVKDVRNRRICYAVGDK